MAEDWLKLYRKLAESDLWLREKFTRGQAWIDLLLLARWKAGYVRVRGIRVDLEPGQLAWSEVELAKRWQWDRKKVRKFLQELENEEQQIEQQKNNVTTIISIRNWGKYQEGGTAEGTAETTANATAEGTAEGTADLYISPAKASFEGPKKGKKDKKGKKGTEEEGGEVVSTPSPENDSGSELASLSSDSLLEHFQNPTVQNLVEKSLDLIASTRRTGKVAESVKHRFVSQLLQFEEWKIGTAITKYIEGEYWLDGKAECYLLGILRNISARDYREVVGRLQNKGSKGEREPPAQDIQPTTWAQAESAERRTMAQWLLEEKDKGGDDAEQETFEARTDQALDSVSGCEARSG